LKSNTLTLTLTLALTLGACASTPRQPSAPTATDTLRILTWNIHIGRGTDGVLDLERIARVILAAHPDVVALQEVDSVTRRTGGADAPRRLAELTGYDVRYAKAMDYDGGGYGVAVLSRMPAAAFRAHPLPADSLHEPRTVAELRARLPRTGLPLLFLATHLDHTADAATRRLQAERIVALFGADSAGVAVLAGDLNDTPGSAALAMLTRRWHDAGDAAPTFPAGAPDRKIDYVLYDPPRRARVLSARVIAEPVASDHRPLLVVFEIRR
jgi:endonuclease/exonuclease/phosphatase family metal-dependent hydrolase